MGNVSIINSLKVCLLLCTLFIINVVQAAEVRIYAAASLTDAITELAKTYQQTHALIKIKPVFAGSSTLAKQIENGAPADVFISADKEWADYLQTRNLLEAKSRADLLANELVLIAPVTHPLHITLNKNTNLAASFDGKLCTGEPASVPVGKYAKQALGYYGWWGAMQTRLVGTEDVRSALAFVERGECAVGIVYKTDALLTKKVTVIAAFPAESHLPIVYPGGLTKNANTESAAFWQFLQSKAALEIFSRYGFKAAHQ
ncbi:MAG: molybdate ABC transporter substrate-binding protein [Cellvibrio sp. 79]|nr:MAG: molybdate ABC transporter substrate-binding protein [Cellvibrio sp. 79]